MFSRYSPVPQVDVEAARKARATTLGLGRRQSMYSPRHSNSPRGGWPLSPGGYSDEDDFSLTKLLFHGSLQSRFCVLLLLLLLSVGIAFLAFSSAVSAAVPLCHCMGMSLCHCPTVPLCQCMGMSWRGRGQEKGEGKRMKESKYYYFLHGGPGFVRGKSRESDRRNKGGERRRRGKGAEY